VIDALPEELRLPLVLSGFDELNSREIAGILAIPEGTVRTRLQRARQILHQKLANFQAPSQEARYAR
jgi:RNA polymerase sigma-70 factor, ECF subfamily